MNYPLDSTLLHSVRSRLLSEFPDQIRTCIQALNDDEIWWRPNEQANSIGNLILHLSGSTRNYIMNCIGQQDFVRDRPHEFAERKRIPRDELLALFNGVIAGCEAVLSALQPGDLTRTTDRTGKTSSYAQILLHVLGHFAAHTGQIVYVTKLLKEGSIDELWMKPRR